MNAEYLLLGEVPYWCAALGPGLVSGDLETSCVNLGSLSIRALGTGCIFPTAAG